MTKDNNGFTLVEILIALTVFLIGSVGVISLFGIAASSQQRAIAYSTASRLAEDLFSDLQSRMVIDTGVNRGLLTASKKIPDNYPVEDAIFADSALYRGFQYKIVFTDVSPTSGLPQSEPEILAMIYVRWPSDGNDFRVGEKPDNEPVNNFEGRIFYGILLRKPW